jgi:hypothetical protein
MKKIRLTREGTGTYSCKVKDTLYKIENPKLCGDPFDVCDLWFITKELVGGYFSGPFSTLREVRQWFSEL